MFWRPKIRQHAENSDSCKSARARAGGSETLQGDIAQRIYRFLVFLRQRRANCLTGLERDAAPGSTTRPSNEALGQATPHELVPGRQTQESPQGTTSPATGAIGEPRDAQLPVQPPIRVRLPVAGSGERPVRHCAGRRPDHAGASSSAARGAGGPGAGRSTGASQGVPAPIGRLLRHRLGLRGDATAIDLNAGLFDSILGNADASFAASVAASVGGAGSRRRPGAGAAVVVGLPTPTTGGATTAAATNPPPVTLGPPPAVYAPAGAAAGVGVSLSPTEFGTNPFTLRAGATISALTPFVVSSGTVVPAPASGGVSLTTGGVDANNIAYTTTTTDSYSLAASQAPDAAGGLTYTETYSFTYDIQTVPAATGGATVHDWGASGYTFLANNDNGSYSFTLIAALSAFESGSQTQTTTADDGSTNTLTTTWQSQRPVRADHRQHDLTGDRGDGRRRFRRRRVRRSVRPGRGRIAGR